MENWEKIIKGYSQTDNNSTVKLIDATVISVASQFVTATVQLITGQIIKNLPNYSDNKIFVGQNVKVGYRTTPDAGWIDKASGNPNPLRLVGYDVETAAIFDSNNIHQWTAEQEMILDINANTKLMYGGHPKLISVQGNPTRYSSVSITAIDASNFGNHLEFDSYWRDSASETTFIECHHTVDVYVKEMTYSVSSGVGYYTYTLAMIRKRFIKSTGQLVWSATSQAWNSYRDLTDFFLIPYITSFSTLPEFNGQPTPYGHIPFNQLYVQFGGIEAANPDVIKTTGIGGGGFYQYSANLQGSDGANSQCCIPITSFAEECFDLAVTKRTVPRALSGG